MGHAVNKVLKDIILKHKISRGIQVHYVPGFDCHGLPIELKASNNLSNSSPLEIRSKARNFASQTLKKQTQSFESWGVLGDWHEKTKVYRTFDKEYVKNQIRIFYDMYEKNLIFRDLKPVYWSPSSATALAEAELEYDESFTSPSLYIKFKLLNSREIINEDCNVLIWTTTPWTLPANQAVCFNPEMKYCVARIDDEKFILGYDNIEHLKESLGDKEIEILKQIDSNLLAKLKYRHPVDQEILPFLPGSHVVSDKGTGFVHTAPSHGQDDFLIFINKKKPLKKYVDEKGCYNANAPNFLHGKNVLSEGNDAVIEHVQNDIVKLDKIVHSYPIDWRTKKPVIIVASEQWFIDTEKIKAKAIEEIENVEFFPLKSSSVFKNGLKTQLSKRPYWCISRQRSWGVPIPVLYNSSTDNLPYVNKECIEHWIGLVEKHGSTDFWWSSTIEDLLPNSQVKYAQSLKKKTDILDIWFDSGISWSFALNGERIADIYLEGVDQLSAWFQSSLITSTAVRGKSPYKSILVHGFVVDENGKKMSKSLGNVISPDTITKKYGTDTLRWWVAAHSTQHSLIPVSLKLLEDSANNLMKIRGTLKYLLGVIGKTSVDSINSENMTHLDKYILHTLSEFSANVDENYQNFQFNRIVAFVNNFVNTDLSSCYLHLIKDRLYCGSQEEHQNIRMVLEECYRGLCRSIWPIAPFLIEESFSYLKDKSFYKEDDRKLSKWHFPDSVEIINSAFNAKRQLYTNLKDLNSWKIDVKISGNDETIKDLKV